MNPEDLPTPTEVMQTLFDAEVCNIKQFIEKMFPVSIKSFKEIEADPNLGFTVNFGLPPKEKNNGNL